MTEFVSISDTEYRQISQLVYDKFGINLGEKKRSLVLGRLHKIVRQNGFENFGEYYEHVLTDQSGSALRTLIDRISTNHTFFYREKSHFEYFSETVLPALANLKDSNSRKAIRIWSAGCSSGEEPYTLAMLISEYLGQDLRNWNAGVLATDISSNVLEKAGQGIYSDENVSRLPSSLKLKYFKKLPDGSWQVVPKIREMVLFRRLNLMRNEFPFRNRFHTIFCRNVMIYFDQVTRDALVHRFHRYLENDGYLFIGHSESLGRQNNYFNYLQPATYKKKGDRQQ
ncbi:MAG: protein-glutamate O-methyltransferase CheR [Calditrichia bacterium]